MENGLTLTVGGNRCVNIQVIDSTTLTCEAPAGSPGTVDITIVNPWGESAMLADGFTYIDCSEQMGDVDCDGTIGLSDAIQVFAVLTGMAEAGPGCVAIKGDPDCNGVLEMKDGILILQYISNNRSGF